MRRAAKTLWESRITAIEHATRWCRHAAMICHFSALFCAVYFTTETVKVAAVTHLRAAKRTFFLLQYIYLYLRFRNFKSVTSTHHEVKTREEYARRDTNLTALFNISGAAFKYIYTNLSLEKTIMMRRSSNNLSSQVLNHLFKCWCWKLSWGFLLMARFWANARHTWHGILNARTAQRLQHRQLLDHRDAHLSSLLMLSIQWIYWWLAHWHQRRRIKDMRRKTTVKCVASGNRFRSDFVSRLRREFERRKSVDGPANTCSRLWAMGTFRQGSQKYMTIAIYKSR